MSMYQTNEDKILQAVIEDEQLIKWYDYSPDDYSSIAEALESDVAVVQAVAQIIQKNEQGESIKEIYNEVANFLRLSI